MVPKDLQSNWRVAKVIDLQREGILLVEDGNHGENRPRPDEFVQDGISFIRAADMANGQILFDHASRINKTARQRIRKGIGAPGDVLLSHKGTVGKVALVPENAPAFVCSPQTTFWRTLAPNELDRRYLHAFLQSDWFHAQLGTRSGETDMAPYVSLTSQRGLSLVIPPIDVQLEIANVIGTLDDKIELNRQMNRTLEEIAHAVFRAWFVDFEGETDLVESELGPIPRGWEVAPVGDLVTTVGGATPSTKNPEYWEQGSIHWTTPRDLSNVDAPVLLDTARKITEKGLEEISSGLLPRGTVLLSSRAPVGYTAIADVSLAVNQGYIAIPPGGKLSSYYMLFWLRENMERIKARAGGTTFQEIGKKSFRPVLAIKPPRPLRDRFDKLVHPFFERIRLNEQQSATLAELRNTLLPRLISGELRVQELRLNRLDLEL